MVHDHKKSRVASICDVLTSTFTALANNLAAVDAVGWDWASYCSSPSSAGAAAWRFRRLSYWKSNCVHELSEELGSKIPEGSSGCSQQLEEQGRGGCQLGNGSRDSEPGHHEQEKALHEQGNTSRTRWDNEGWVGQSAASAWTRDKNSL